MSGNKIANPFQYYTFSQIMSQHIFQVLCLASLLLLVQGLKISNSLHQFYTGAHYASVNSSGTLNISASNFPSSLLPLPSLNTAPPAPQSYGLLPNSTVTVLNMSTPSSPNLTNSSAPLFSASPNLPQNGTFPNSSAPLLGSSNFSNSSGFMNASAPQNGSGLNFSMLQSSPNNQSINVSSPFNSSAPQNGSNQNFSVPSIAPTVSPSINASSLNGSNGSALNGFNLNVTNGLNQSNSSNSSSNISLPAFLKPNPKALASISFPFMNQTYQNYLASTLAANASNSSNSSASNSTTPPLNSTSSAHPQNTTQGPLLMTVSGSSSHHLNHSSSAHNCPPGTHWFPEYKQCDFCPQGLTFNPRQANCE